MSYELIIILFVYYNKYKSRVFYIKKGKHIFYDSSSIISSGVINHKTKSLPITSFIFIGIIVRKLFV